MGKSFFLSIGYLFLSTSLFCQDITEPAVLPAKIVITEIMYNPPEAGTDSLEFIELYNNDTSAINLLDFYFAAGVIYTFPDSILNVHDHILVARNAGAIVNTFGVTALQWTSGSLSNNGELILLKDSFNVTVDSVSYDNVLPWDPEANGLGPSLELCEPDSDNSIAGNWSHALEYAAVNEAGDTIRASPLTGCTAVPTADFFASESTIGVGDLVQFTDSSSGSVSSWIWEFEGGNPGTFSGEVPPPVRYDTSGNFDVRLTVANISGQDSRLKIGYIKVGMTGINETSGDNIFLIGPNPNDGKFSMIMPGKSRINIEIFSTAGILIKHKFFNGSEINEDISDLGEGLYFLRISDPATGKHMMKKIIIRK